MHLHAKGRNLDIHEDMHSHTWGKPTCAHIHAYTQCRQSSRHARKGRCCDRFFVPFVCVRVWVSVLICVFVCERVHMYNSILLTLGFLFTQVNSRVEYRTSVLLCGKIYRYEYTCTYMHIYSHEFIYMPTCLRISLYYNIAGANSGLGYEASKFFLQVNCFGIFYLDPNSSCRWWCNLNWNHCIDWG